MPKKPVASVDRGSRARPRLTYSDIEPFLYLDDSPLYPAQCLLLFDGFVAALPKDTSDHDSVQILCVMDLSKLSPILTQAQLRYSLKAHGEKVGSDRSVVALRSRLQNHQCTAQCPGYITVFKAKNSAIKPIRFLGPVEFPPPPMSNHLEHRILTDFINACSPDQFEEDGCKVCGQLTVMRELQSWDPELYNLNLLVASDATRRERTSSDGEILSLDGPVLALQPSWICNSCHSYLSKHLTPPMALCNGFWLGEIPEALTDLTFAEQQMIARIRHNVCVMRVASGRGKLTANAVMLSNPTVKIYHMLPPSKDEMSEVLAYIHLGSKQPTMDDYKRTPMLVRRDRVLAALEWLRLNHSEYEDLEISHENLHTYDLHDVVCDVDWRPNEHDELQEALTHSSTDAEETEPGTTSGPCSFRVHGLTGVQFDGLSMSEIKLKALHHMNSGHKALGIGHGGKPVTMYDNPSAYPSMFPWLFPYGKGGIGNALVEKHNIGEDRQKRRLLMYFDKRFQTDLYFPMIAFNHAQLKSSTTGSYLTARRKDFHRMAKRLIELKPHVIEGMMDRMGQGEKVIPQNEDEEACFQVLRDLDHVGGHVKGSLTSKRYMQNEVWSLIAHRGAPSWFITLSPADSKHPLSLYYADSNAKFSLELRGADEREHLVAQNPVAAARFFNYLVTQFLEHVLGHNTNHAGVFGETDAFYGTVEQQGRLTLHLHMLVWVRNAPSPQVLRDKMLGPDGEAFQDRMIQYLESCHQGHLNTGSLEDISARFPRKQRGMKREVHETAEYEESSQGSSYKDPTQTLPEAPPPFCADPPHESCEACFKYKTWRLTYLSTIDDIVSRSNVHTHYALKTDSTKTSRQKQKKEQRKGCLSTDGVCNKRFPRDIVPETTVDPETGSITMKHLISMINTITNLIAYLIRSNTDTSCLLSGTALKAVVSYVADYITKPGLKTHHIMSTLRDTLHNKLIALLKDDKRSNIDNARALHRQIINALSAKLEIGSPMAALYLLGFPDHVTSHDFVLFWWKSFVGTVLGNIEDELYNDEQLQQEDETCPGLAPEKVFVNKDGEEYTGYSSVDDYVYRPTVFDHICLYDWVRFSCRKIQRSERLPQDWHHFLPGHPGKSKYIVKYDPFLGETVVANFVGGSLPRKDQGDREFYCCTMLTLFRPWRKGSDLKIQDQSWDDAFSEYGFTQFHLQKMDNFHVKFECRDEKDDYHRQMKLKKKAAQDAKSAEKGESISDDDDEDDDVDWMPEEISMLGPEAEKQMQEMHTMERIMRRASWLGPKIGAFPEDDKTKSVKKRCAIARRKASDWKKSVDATRAATLEARKWRSVKKGKQNQSKPQLDWSIRPQDINRVEPVDALAHLYPEHAKERITLATLKEDIIRIRTLNEKQKQAFLTVANHATADNEKQEPMLMHLAGMGGTGKSRVLHSLVDFFEARHEGYRFLILGPTGTAAAAVGGSTYHSALGICGPDEDGVQQEPTDIRKVFDYLEGVEYIFIDEVSMVGCRELYQISARMATAMNQERLPFGGVSMIFAGNFAQLPPVKSTPLYVEKQPKNTAGPKTHEQEVQLGRALWKQVTTVVVLTEIMRQNVDSDEDDAFRKALANLRYADCTEEDIQFFKSRIVGNGPGRPKLNEYPFRNAAVIVTRNSERDRLNELGVERFAADSEQELHEFYSIDAKPSQGRGRKKTKSKFDDDTAEILWNAPPGTTDHLAGRLRLCVGMPVIIRNNDATELCITKGQEGIVYGWDDVAHPTAGDNVRVLETLFVELVGAPRKVQIPGLPVNVVPLTRATRSIKCTLPNDTTVTISRNQVEVLPLFAMTDYGAQGKSRESNVASLSGCRSVNSIYTILSRGTSAKHTAIIQPFDTTKFKQKRKGYICQEFREMHLLDEITELKYKGQLPPQVKGHYRNALIRSYQKYRGEMYDPKGLPPSLAWKPSDGSRIPVEEAEPKWRVIPRDSTDKSSGKGKNKKRTNLNTIENVPKRRCVPQQLSPPEGTCFKWKTDARSQFSVPVPKPKDMTAPVGPVWDPKDHSCAYDCLFFLLWNVWSENEQFWGQKWLSTKGISERCANGFEMVKTGQSSLEAVRDEIRSVLSDRDPLKFPKGGVLTALDWVACELFTERINGYNVEHCTSCQVQHVGNNTTLLDSFALTHMDIETRSVSEWFLKYLMDARTKPCEKCGIQARIKQKKLTYFPDLVHLFPVAPGLMPETDWGVLMWDSTVQARKLVGAIYSDNRHFISRYIDPLGVVWLHDGRDGSNSVREGSIHSIDILSHPKVDYKLASVVYIRRPI